MLRKVKIGFIGAGAVGQMHIKHWSHLPECEPVALADLRPNLRGLVAKKFKIPRSYNSHTELIADPDIEAVVVVTRRHNTAAVVNDCLHADKHVFSEKPIAKTLEQARQLAELGASLGLTYAIGYQRRHDAGTVIAKAKFDQLITSGELGQVTSVRIWNFTGADRSDDAETLMTGEERPDGLRWLQTPDWLPEQRQPTYDRFINVFCHDVNMQRYFFRRNPEVRFANLSRDQEWQVVLDFGEFLANFAGRIYELNDGGKPGNWDEGFEIMFERGRLRVTFSPPLEHGLCNRVELKRDEQEMEVLCSGTGHAPAFQLQAENFLNDVLHKRNPIASGLDAVRDLALIEDIWRVQLSLQEIHA